jgi:hypothetical protein
MDTTNEIRQLILKNSSSDQIRDAARRNGMRPLAEDGWRLVREGVTTLEEVLRVTKDQSLGDATENKPAARPATATATEISDALVSV